MKGFHSGVFCGLVFATIFFMYSNSANLAKVANNTERSQNIRLSAITPSASLHEKNNLTTTAIVSHNNSAKNLPDADNKPNEEYLRAALAAYDDAHNFSALLTNHSWLDLTEKAKTQFKDEQIDSNWASEYSLKLDNYFLNSPELSSLYYQGIECRSTRCLVSVSLSSPEELSSVTEKISTSIRKNSAGIPQKILFTESSNSYSLEFFLVRTDEDALIN
jgi:hypothetical protein